MLTNLTVAIGTNMAQLNYYRIYDRGYEEWAWDLESTHDEGFIIVGQTTENQDDIILIKTDYFGDTIWTKSIGGLSWDYGYSISISKKAILHQQ